MVVTSALNGGLLTVHLLERAFSGSGRGRMAGAEPRLPRLHPAGWLLLPFLIYAAINVRWITPVPWLGWRDWLGWAQLILVFWVVLNGVRARAARLTLFFVFVILGCVVVLLASYQHFVAPNWLMLGRTQAAQFTGRSSGSFGLPNSLAAFLLLILPIVGALTLRRGATAIQRLVWGYLTIAFGFALLLTISRGAWLALGLVVAVSPIFAVGGSVARKIGYLVAVWLALAMVAVVVHSTVPAVRDRMAQLKTNTGELSRPIMWRAAWAIFRDQPAWGGGAGSYSVRIDRYRPEDFQLEARWAHNDYLNTLSDYGIAGFAFFFGACGVIVVRCLRSRASTGRGDWFDGYSFTAGLSVGAAAFALQLLVDFNLKIPALAMSFAVITAMLVQRQWPAKEYASVHPGRVDQIFALLIAVGTSAATTLLVMPVYRGEAMRQTARRLIDQLALQRLAPREPVLITARDGLIAATKTSPSNGNAWADLAYATTLLTHFNVGRFAELGRDAERSADRALGCSREVAEFWIQRGVALDLQGRWVEAGSALVQALQLAPTRASVWYQQAFHLSLNRAETERALAAVTLSLRLDPGNPEAHALHQRLAERSRAP